jgi:hypothetical protein
MRTIQNVRNMAKSERQFHRRWEELQRQKAAKLAKEQHEANAKPDRDSAK